MGFEIDDLRVSVCGEDGRDVDVVRGVSLEVRPGETSVLVGESGSGKSVTALAALGLLPRNLRRSAGRILLDWRVLESESDFASIRGRSVALVVQEPRAGLDPCHAVKDLVRMAARATHDTRAAARREATTWLDRVGLEGDLQGAFPHQLSGGQRQRALLAMALVNRPRFLVADEPTSSLDVTVQGNLLGLLRELRDEAGLGLLLVTHDRRVASAMADRLHVLDPGGPTRLEVEV